MSGPAQPAASLRGGVLGALEGAGGTGVGPQPWPHPGRHLLWASLLPRVKQNSESERRSPSSEDDRDERESRAEIQNTEDYNEIFQPKNSISEARALPPLPSEPQRPPLSLEADGPFQGWRPCPLLP